MRITPKEDECFRHLLTDCDTCPYYEYTVRLLHEERTGRFWVGQEVYLGWGAFGDGIHLSPKQQGQRLN